MNKYYFYFAFENSKCKDYISEKVYRALQVIRMQEALVGVLIILIM